jgi:hypothetical protein
VDHTLSEHCNPYQSPGAAADARSKLGWLVMLLILWPIVMAAVGSIVGYFVGRLAPDDANPQVWNPGIGALIGAGAFALAGLAIGACKASALRGRLDQIHARREELRQEMERRLADSEETGSASERNGRASDEHAP